jgi:hypothetical protein
VGGGEGLLLSELYNYYALAHAIGAMLHGNEEVARYFIDLSKKTVRFRVKRKILKYMLVLGFLGTRVLRVSSTFMLVFLLPILKSILGSYKKKF